MTSVRRALAISFLERYLTVALALASNMLLARLLTPHEIGVYSVSLAVIGIAQVLREFGIGNYLIQEKELTDDHLRTAFGISLWLGGSLFGVVFVATPYAAGFYGEPAMTQTLRIAALNFLVLPFCTVRLALLRRAMRFKELLYVSLVATIVSQLVTVGLAWAGCGPDSMAIGSVVLNLAMALGTFLAHEDRRILAPSLAKWRSLMSFGGQSALTNVVGSVSVDANDLILGKILGFGPVAMISRAQGLINLFYRDVMGAIRNVALPAFAQAHRDGLDVAARFRRIVVMIGLFAWPFYGWLAIYALEVLRVLFGPQWGAAQPLVVTFCGVGAIAVFNSLVPTLLVAVGQIGTLTKLELSMHPLRLAVVVVAVLSFRTMESAAWAVFAFSTVSAPVFLIVARRVVPGLLEGLPRDALKTAGVSVCALLPAVIYGGLMGSGRSEPVSYLGAIATVLMGVVLGVLAAERLRHPVLHEPLYLQARARLSPLRLKARSPKRQDVPPMLSICYVVKGFPLASETFISDEAHALRVAGVDVRVLHLQPGQTDVVHQSAQALLDEGRSRQLDQRGTRESLISLALLLARRPMAVGRLLWRHRLNPDRWMFAKAAPHAVWCLKQHIEYLHAHFADINLQYAAILSDLTGIPYGVTTHRYDLIDDPLPIDQASAVMRRASVMVTISYFNKRLMESKFGLDAQRIRIIRCGVELESFPYREPAKRSPSDPLRIVSVGRLVHVKGHDVLIKALGVLRREGRDCTVRIVGAGPEHDRLHELADAEGVINHVVLLGALRHDEVRAELESADLFVLSSRSEGIPVACMETMASGTPIIATRINGLPELISDQVNGQLVEPDNPMELVEAISRVIDNPSGALEMSMRARETIESEFSRRRSTAEWLDLLGQQRQRGCR